MDDKLRDWIDACDEATGAQPPMDLAEWLAVTAIMLALGAVIGYALCQAVS